MKRAELIVDDSLSIPAGELHFSASRSSGPGGQNVNKVASRVTLRFDVASSPALNDEQKERIRNKLRTRMTQLGVLRVVSQKHRTQGENRREAERRFVLLLQEALREETSRVATRPSKASRQRRLEDKRRRSRRKRERGRHHGSEDH